jgi:hypothetical protein
VSKLLWCFSEYAGFKKSFTWYELIYEQCQRKKGILNGEPKICERQQTKKVIVESAPGNVATGCTLGI